MKKGTLFTLVAALAFAVIPVVSTYSHQAAAQPPDYNEVTKTGDEDPETTLTARIPKSVSGVETFDILTTVSCEEGEEYDGCLNAYIWEIEGLAATEVEDYEEWIKKNEETLDAITEALEEMDPEEVEEAFESEEPIEVHTATGTCYAICYNWPERLVKVTSTEQTLPLVSPPASSYSSPGQVLGGEEMMEFVTPDNWEVERLVEEIAAECDDKWEGYYAIHRWVKGNIKKEDHESGGGEYWKYPEETLCDEEGDRGDIACLKCSMLICYDQMIDEIGDQWYVLRVAFGRRENLGRHAIVIGNVEGYVQIYGKDFDNYGEMVEVDELEEVWEDYEDFWRSEIVPCDIFNDESYEELSGLEDLKEFLSD